MIHGANAGGRRQLKLLFPSVRTAEDAVYYRSQQLFRRDASSRPSVNRKQAFDSIPVEHGPSGV